ncbi:hypothetical protein [Streptomyces barringtoniae]|uniref:hypothetical protein n=1 Tax=Streptomyces barringtoniae TaxID=2892029 RepID=UPI001E2B49BB|nr:hypothetical protein [Streptomyces barringtoniae]MCC5477663.1 hypothetical protein [Streptomyces barringtoniae]
MRAQGDEAPAAGGVGDAAARQAQDTGEPARREIGAVRNEITAAPRRRGAGELLAGAGTCQMLALAAGHPTLPRPPGSVMPERTAAAAPSGACTAGAVGPATAARDRIRAAARAAV